MPWRWPARRSSTCWRIATRRPFRLRGRAGARGKASANITQRRPTCAPPSPTNVDAGLPAIRATIAEARERGEPTSFPLYTNLTSLMAAARRHDGLLEAIDEGMDRNGARPGPLATYLAATARALLTWAASTRRSPRSRWSRTLSPHDGAVGDDRAQPRAAPGPAGRGARSARRADVAARPVAPRADRDRRGRSPLADGGCGPARPNGWRRCSTSRSRSGAVESGEIALWPAILAGRRAFRTRSRPNARTASRPRRRPLARAAALAGRGGCLTSRRSCLSGRRRPARGASIFDRSGEPAARKLRRRLRATAWAVSSGPRTAAEDPAAWRPARTTCCACWSTACQRRHRRSPRPQRRDRNTTPCRAGRLEAPSRLAVQIGPERGLCQG